MILNLCEQRIVFIRTEHAIAPYAPPPGDVSSIATTLPADAPPVDCVKLLGERGLHFDCEGNITTVDVTGGSRAKNPGHQIEVCAYQPLRVVLPNLPVDTTGIIVPLAVAQAMREREIQVRAGVAVYTMDDPQPVADQPAYYARRLLLHADLTAARGAQPCPGRRYAP